MPEAIEIGIDVTSPHLWMLGRLVYRQYRRKAGVAPRGNRHPFIPRPRCEDLRKTLAHRRPCRAVVLVWKIFTVEADHVEEVGVEMRLNGSYRNKFSLLGRITPIERRTAVDNVVGAPFGPAPLVAKGLERRHQMGDAVDHGDVDRLPLARPSRFH